MATQKSYKIEGSYYEACNCEAICPCRRHNGVAKGLSTYGNCDFLLSWQIDKGDAGGVDLSGVGVGMAGTYSDHEEGSPWSVFIYIAEHANDDQFEALSAIFKGDAGGNILFTKCISNVLGIKRAKIAFDHTPGAELIQIDDIASAKVERNAEYDGTVSCGIPGHDHPGQESVSSLAVNDGELQWSYEARCGFATDFSYSNS